MNMPKAPRDNALPGPSGLPGIGVSLSFLRDPIGVLERSAAAYGPIFRLPLGGRSLVFLNDPVDVEQVLRLDFKSFGQSATHEQLLAPLLGRGIASVAEHAYWEELHRIFMPAFTPRMLQRYFVQTAHVTATEVEQLDALQRAGRNVDFYEFTRLGVFTALTKTLFTRGIDEDEIPGILDLFMRSNAYMNARYLTNASPITSVLPAVRAGKRCLEQIDERVYQLIRYRKEHRVDAAEDMLDALLEARFSDGSAMTDVQLRDNIMTLFFGGQETTPSAITWAFGLLAANPDKRATMLEEIDSVLGDRTPTFEDLARLRYTDMVFDEAMRMYPAFSFLAREALADTKLRGHEIKAGTTIAFPGWTIHRNPEHWPEPDVFLPERHDKDTRRGRAKCAFIPFGYGQRRCIGERVARIEAILMLVMISQRFLLEHVDGRLPPARVQMSIKPVGQMPMRIVPRHHRP